MSQTITDLKLKITHGNATAIAKAMQAIDRLKLESGHSQYFNKRLVELSALAVERMIIAVCHSSTAQQLQDNKKEMGKWMKVLINADYNSEQYSHAKEKYNSLKEANELIDKYWV